MVLKTSFICNKEGATKMEIRVKLRRIPNQELINEMINRGMLFEGHYKLKNMLCSNVFIYPRRAREMYGLRTQLMFILQQLGYNAATCLHVCLQENTTRIIRSALDMYQRPPKSFVYPYVESGTMKLTRKDVERLRKQPFMIVDDVLRKGVGMTKLIALCREHGLSPFGAVTAFSAGRKKIDGITVHEVVRFPIKQWHPDKCPLCKAGNVPYDPYHFHRDRIPHVPPA